MYYETIQEGYVVVNFEVAALVISEISQKITDHFVTVKSATAAMT